MSRHDYKSILLPASLRPRLAGLLALVLMAMLAGCDSGTDIKTSSGTPLSGLGQTITITGTAFSDGQPIPRTYTCDGDNISPPLQWTDPPADTKSLALIMDDPDAPGTFVHWVLYGLPPSARSLPENVPTTAQLDDGSSQGNNGSGNPGYTGSCPPGGTHHYHFKLYALDTTLDLQPGADKNALEQAMDGHVLAYGELVGTYSR